MTSPAPVPAEGEGYGGTHGNGDATLPNNVRQLHPTAPRRFEWPISLVSLILLISLGVASADHFRRGAVLFSFGVILAFFLRLLLPERDAGLLAVRSKRLDLVVLGGLALSVSLLSFLVPPPS